MCDTSKTETIRDHPKREAILGLLEAKPGLNANQVQRELGFSTGVMDYHLGRLEERGEVIVKEGRSGWEKILLTPDTVHLWKDSRTRLLYGGPATRSVGIYIAEQPGASTKEMAQANDIDPVTVRYHVDKLKDRDLAGSIRAGRRIEYHPTFVLREWYQEVGHRYDRPWEKRACSEASVKM